MQVGTSPRASSSTAVPGGAHQYTLTADCPHVLKLELDDPLERKFRELEGR